MNLFSLRCLPRVGSLLLVGLAILSVPAKADVDQLWITELVPSSGMVEVTNVGDEVVTLNTAFPFCHRFSYSNRIPAGTRFEAGESKVFELSGLNPADSDLFLYRDSNFGESDSIISGLRYGSESLVGRSGIAASAGIWPAPTASTAVPSPGQSLALVGPDPFSPDHWVIQSPDLGKFEVAPMPSIEVRVIIENMAPEQGTFLTPLWIGIHDGSFDSYDGGSPSSPGIERIAEDGNALVLSEEFQASGARLEAVLNEIGPIGPNQVTSTRLWLDPNAATHQFFSYVAMVIPSNDAYVANGNPTAHALFDENGQLMNQEILILGSDVNDAGTEINDELPANTAFFGQSAPNTGTSENGVNQAHPGFKAADQGGILADPQFSDANFLEPGYVIGKITLQRVEAKPSLVSVTIRNSAQDGGTFQTPVWIGVHDGSFDLFDLGSTASEALERLAEDGNTDDISQAFDSSQAGNTQRTIISNGEIPPFAPGDNATITLELDANDPKNRYLSFASMVIPSNDAFVANSDPKAYPIFDGEGQLIKERIILSNLQVYDAGTEVNDEIPENTAFLAQSTPNTGTSEEGVVTIHQGFNAAGSGGIADQPSFSNAGVNLPNQQSLQLSLGEGILIDSISASDNQIDIAWSGGRSPFIIQGRSEANGGEWENLATSSVRTVTLDRTDDKQFIRIIEESAFPSETARFSVTFDAQWSRTLHPTDFPSSPHFSGLIGATHNSEASLWSPGARATPGIRRMAETGSKSPLTSEIATLVAGGTAAKALSGGGVGRSPGSVSLEFDISQSHPLVSLVSMIAPSPDWFIGVHGLNLMANGDWADELTIDLEPYDSGTDSGVTYTSSNQASNPQGVIARVSDAPLDSSLGLPPLGQFIFTRID